MTRKINTLLWAFTALHVTQLNVKYAVGRMTSTGAIIATGATVREWPVGSVRLSLQPERQVFFWQTLDSPILCSSASHYNFTYENASTRKCFHSEMLPPEI